MSSLPEPLTEAALSQRDREILKRFFLQEQSQEQICREMALTETQFRLLRSRAKARLGKIVNLEFDSSSGSLPTMGLGEIISVELGTSPSSLPAVERILPIVAHAVAVFGDENKASHWLATPLPLLQNRSPSQVLEEQGGIELVEQVLTRIEHNIPS